MSTEGDKPAPSLLRQVHDQILENLRAALGEVTHTRGPDRTLMLLHIAKAHAALDHAASARRRAAAKEYLASRGR